MGNSFIERKEGYFCNYEISIHLALSGGSVSVTAVEVWNFSWSDNGNLLPGIAELRITLSNLEYIYQAATDYEYEVNRHGGTETGYYRFATEFENETYWTDWVYGINRRTSIVNGVSSTSGGSGEPGPEPPPIPYQ